VCVLVNEDWYIVFIYYLSRSKFIHTDEKKICRLLNMQIWFSPSFEFLPVFNVFFKLDGYKNRFSNSTVIAYRTVFSKSLKNLSILSKKSCFLYLLKWRSLLVKHLLSLLSIPEFTWASSFSQFPLMLISLCKCQSINFTFPIKSFFPYFGSDSFTITIVILQLCFFLPVHWNISSHCPHVFHQQVQHSTKNDFQLITDFTPFLYFAPSLCTLHTHHITCLLRVISFQQCLPRVLESNDTCFVFFCSWLFFELCHTNNTTFPQYSSMCLTIVIGTILA